MTKSATDVMEEIVFSAMIDAIVAFRQASGGLPNALAREVGAVHPNTTPADLPEPVRAAIAGSVRAAFARLRKEGYAVTSATAPRPAARPPAGGPPRGPRPGPPKPPVVETKRPRGPKGPPRGR